MYLPIQNNFIGLTFRNYFVTEQSSSHKPAKQFSGEFETLLVTLHSQQVRLWIGETMTKSKTPVP